MAAGSVWLWSWKDRVTHRPCRKRGWGWWMPPTLASFSGTTSPRMPLRLLRMETTLRSASAPSYFLVPLLLSLFLSPPYHTHTGHVHLLLDPRRSSGSSKSWRSRTVRSQAWSFQRGRAATVRLRIREKEMKVKSTRERWRLHLHPGTWSPTTASPRPGPARSASHDPRNDFLDGCRLKWCRILGHCGRQRQGGGGWAWTPHVLKQVSWSRQEVSGGQKTRDNLSFFFLTTPEVLPATDDDSDNKSASDLSDSELCGVSSASEPNASRREICLRLCPWEKLTVDKHAQYFTLI